MTLFGYQAVFAVSKSIYYYGKKKQIEYVAIRGTSYISFAQLAKSVFPGSKYDQSKYEIKHQGSVVRSSPSSFFIAYKSNSGMKVAQMNMPAIIYENKLYVPFESFMTSLEILEIYSVKAKSGKYYISKYVKKKQANEVSAIVVKKTAESQSKPKQDSAANSEQETTGERAEKVISEDESSAKSTNNVFKKSIYNSKKAISSGLSELMKMNAEKSEENNENKAIKVDKKEYPPNVYVLPPELKRKELNQK
jgi:hypothetical protein